MHGYSWDAARAKYQPLVEYVADKYELLNIVNENDRRAECIAHRRGGRAPAHAKGAVPDLAPGPRSYT